MRFTRVILLIVFISVISPDSLFSQSVILDETPAAADDWGYRPSDGSVSNVNPPGFAWRFQEDMTWNIEVARDKDFKDIVYSKDAIAYNVHCPPKVFQEGEYRWRYRGRNIRDAVSGWSNPRTFTIARGASKMPLPPKDELLARVPKTHPRLFVRPENIGRLRTLAKGELSDIYDRLTQATADEKKNWLPRMTSLNKKKD